MKKIFICKKGFLRYVDRVPDKKELLCDFKRILYG